MLKNLFIDKKSKKCINSRSIIVSSSISIFIYIFAFCVYFLSNYQYGQDYDLEKVVREANFIHISLVLIANLFILLFFVYRSNKIIPHKVYIYRFSSNFYKWILASLPLFLLNLYYISNVTDRITSKEASTLFIQCILYLFLALQSWIILTSRNKLIVILSLILILTTGIFTFEREPFLFAYFGILIRTISSGDKRSLPILILSLPSVVTNFK